MEVYVDILIFENFIVNLFLLILTMKILKYKYRDVLLICAGLIGALYTIVLLFPQLYILTSLPFKMMVVYIMIRISYGKRSVISIFKAMGIFLLLTFTLSGLCFAFSINQNKYVLGSSFEINKYSIKYLLLSVMIIYMFFTRAVEYIKNKLFITNYKFMIEFTIEDTTYDIQSFLDTGNELREPVTNLPCILIEEELINTINFNSKNTYYVPYASIGYGGNLKGIKVEEIKIKGEHSYNNKVEAIICPCSQKLSKENDFNALLSRGVV
ncbi:sigma-E processing peptidase SpoIIGA [Clostridium uliginosum]|uniref:Sporulation sigma-E factor-processing peptidase n=1 Tax=Clostridium uliginosum TaxID=119641 RepID=A0A1I1LF49_9CLOT|nr:sigma-E processing peptidase SpoIIGA [Clostridium uliginosum]SFC71787.1 stage II sporulation protein GA (sporulation sigma-E factor processing peptidase) [Clostridium uliginosum]